MFGLAIGIGAGLLLPVQTCINSRLREALGSPFLSSLGSFLGGTIFLFLLTLIVNHSVALPAGLVGQQPTWIWLGGLFGVIGLTTNILIFPYLGGVQTTVLPVSGQILMGLIIDQFGLFGAQQTPLNFLRVAGAVLVLLGVLGAVMLGGQKMSKKKTRGKPNSLEGRDATTQQNSVGPSSGRLWAMRALALFAGFLMASQAAINGHLGVLVGSSLKAALVSFSIGSIALILLVMAQRLKVRVRVPEGKSSNPLWMWFGGVLGALYVLGSAFLVPLIGAGLTIVATLLGMISGSLAVDKFGVLEAPKRYVGLPQVISLVVMLVGVVLIRLV